MVNILNLYYTLYTHGIESIFTEFLDPLKLVLPGANITQILLRPTHFAFKISEQSFYISNPDAK